MWLAVILLCCAVIIMGAISAPKPVGYGLVAIGVVARILAATGWGPRYRGEIGRSGSSVTV